MRVKNEHVVILKQSIKKYLIVLIHNLSPPNRGVCVSRCVSVAKKKSVGITKKTQIIIMYFELFSKGDLLDEWLAEINR